MTKRKSSGSLLITVIVLAVIVYLLMDRSPFGGNNSSFAVKEKTDISRIDFRQGNDRLTLHKDGDDWIVDKNLKTRKSAVMSLIRTLESMEIKSPVTPQTFREEIIDRSIDPVKVTVYKKRRIVKSFFVYKTPSNIYGNIMKIKPNSKPFIVYLPGYEDNIGVFFNLNELYWQPFTVFNYLPSQIQSVLVENVSDPESSFKIETGGGDIALTDNSGRLTGWDTSRVRRYLSYFTSIQFESWATDLSSRSIDSITKSKPACRITVEESGGNKRILTVWDKWKDEGSNNVKDTDRLWGKTGDVNLLFIIRYFDLDPILKKKSYFFEN